MHRKEACISCGKISILRCGSKNGMFYTVTNLVLYVVEAGLYGAKKENCKLELVTEVKKLERIIILKVGLQTIE